MKSTERATDLHTERIELQSTDQSPALVQGTTCLVCL